MKIGILTFHRALNYGAVLQCYALSTFLNEMGHDVEVIDYRPQYIEKYRKLFYWKDFKKLSLISKIVYIIKLPINCINKYKASNIFDEFLMKHFRFSLVVKSKNDIPSYYDAILFGSDQIWNPRICEGFDPIFFGQINIKGTLLITYAASLDGQKDFTEDQWDYIIEHLTNFDAISVREKAFQEDLLLRQKRDVEFVLDPTLLVPPSVINKISSTYASKLFKQKYILLYVINKRDEELSKEVAFSLALKKGLKIVNPKVFPGINRNHSNIKVVKACSPEDWCSLINNSECVVTNSFHATAISIQLRKEVLVVRKDNSARLEDLLKSTGLYNRYLSKIEDLERINTIDFVDVHSRISDMRLKAKVFLNNYI